MAPSFSRMICAGAAAAALAGCGAETPPRVSAQGWMVAAASAHDLLYVSDSSSGNVYIFSYPTGRPVGTLKGFDAWNLCGDSSGNVFITVQAGRILEVTHGGTKPVNTLRDSYYPIACSVDPNTGNLGVANESGSVSIYPKATGQPTLYKTPLIPLFCAYDNAGNLFAASSGAPGVRIAELRKGGTAFTTFTYRGRNAGEPAGLQWVGGRLAVGIASPYQRQCCGRIFTFRIRGAHGRRVGRTHIGGALLNFFVEGSTAIVATFTDSIAFYAYPNGGPATKVIKESGDASYGVVVSAAPR